MILSAQLRTMLETRYAIGKIRTGCALTGGERNDILRLDCARRSYVVRISHALTTPAGVAYEHRLMRFMNLRIPAVLAPLVAQDDSTYFSHNQRIISLFPCMPGQMADRENAAICVSAAKMLAQLHQAGLAYPETGSRPGRAALGELAWDHNHMWQWAKVETLLLGKPEAFAQAASHLDESRGIAISQVMDRREQIIQEKIVWQAWVAALHRSGRALLFAPTHGDYHAHNVLSEDNQISAVLDWDECQPEWLVYELGRAMWEFSVDKNTHSLREQKALTFLHAYQAAGGPVPAVEFDLLVPFIQCVRILEVLFDLGQVVRNDKWDSAYTLHNLLALENLRDCPLPKMLEQTLC